MNWVPTMRHQIMRQAARKPRVNICACKETQNYTPFARRMHTQLPLAPTKLQYVPFRMNNVRPQIATRGFGVAGSIGLGLGLGVASTYVIQNVVLCEPIPGQTNPSSQSTAPANAPPGVPPGAYDPDQPLPPPKSIANPYELTFGTVCGICTGIFVKKGLKAAAFILGGLFVILQYFNGLSWINVDWASAESRFKRTFYTTTENGQSRPPTIESFFTWLFNFVMADFQPRASFLAGLLLGLRVG
ncbi:hypothetical protein CPB86DRAFT_544113 [Serendipita vermifera]|nr:hypothetical protein CPB86DRAFT_544113 [Serendipita vermifera]